MITKWQIRVYNPNTQTWGDYSDNMVSGIKNPDSAIIDKAVSSTAESIILVDGDEALIIPEIKYRAESYTFEWNRLQLSGNQYSGNEFINKIKEFTQCCSGIKIKDHTSEVLEGRFMGYNIIYEPKLDENRTQRVTLRVTFKPISVLNGVGF